MSIAEQTFDVETIRAQFPILRQPDSHGRQVIYLDNGASAQKHESVIECEHEVYTKYYANAYRGVYEFGQRIDDGLEQGRETVREMIGAEQTEEIIFTSGTTMSLNVIAHSWGSHVLKPDDEILLSIMEHHANIVPWQMIAKQTGSKIRYVPLTEDGRLDLLQFEEMLSERTKIVSLTGMSNVLGTTIEPGAISQRVHDVGAVLVIDAAQSILHQPVDVVKEGIDFLTFSGHKIYGPSGVGVLYGRRELLEQMPPFVGGGHMIDRVYQDHSEWAALPAKFEAGTIPIAQAIALKPALEFVQGLGYDSIQQHERALLQHALNVVTEVPGLTIYGPAPEFKGGIVSFTMEGAHPQDLAYLLNRHGICVRHGHHCTMPLHDHLGLSASVRASFAIYNTLEEIDALGEALHAARKRLRLA